MYRWLVLILILFSASAYGQGVSNFGASRPEDSSKTRGQIVAPAYGIPSDSAMIIVLPNGTFRKVSISTVRGSGSTPIDSNLYVTVTRLSDSMALIRALVGTKVDSVTKSNDTFYYWKLGAKTVAGVVTGSATPNLQQVTDVGNSTDNPIRLFGDSPTILFDETGAGTSGYGLGFQEGGAFKASIVYNSAEDDIEITNSTGDIVLYGATTSEFMKMAPDGTVTTTGLDNYDSNLAGSYTARTKTDKNYVDSVVGTIIPFDSSLYFKRDTGYIQPPGLRTNYLETDRMFIGDRDTGATFTPRQESTNYGLGIKKVSIDGNGTGHAIVATNRAAYTGDIGNNRGQGAGYFYTFVPNWSVGEWGTTKPTHPNFYSTAHWSVIQAEAKGHIRYGAGIFTSIINGSDSMEIDEANLINASFGQMRNTKYAVGLRMSVLNRGSLGNTGIWLCESDGDAPFSGNWGIFNYMNMRNYFRGSLQIGNLIQTIPEKFYVEGTMRITDTARFSGEIRTPILSSLLKTSSGGFVQAAVAGTDYVIPSALTAYQQYADTNTWDATKTYTEGRYIKFTDSAAMLNDYVNFVDTFTRIATKYDNSLKLNYTDTAIYWRIGGQGLTGVQRIGSTTEANIRIMNGSQDKIIIQSNTTNGLMRFKQSSGVFSTGIIGSEAFMTLADSTTTGINQMFFGIGKGTLERYGNPFILFSNVTPTSTSPRAYHTNDSAAAKHFAFKYINKVRVDNGGISAQTAEVLAPPTATTMNTFYVREAGSNEIKQITPTGTPSNTTFLRGDWSWATPSGGGLSASNFVFNEVPSGTINSSNTAFTLANTPTAGTVQLFKNGQLLTPITDYTVSGSGITMVVAPLTGNVLLAHYMK